MPPSGYSREQIAALQGFLRLCSEALFREAQDRAQPLSNALRQEGDDIDASLGTAGTHSEPAVLQLTRDFYRRVADLNPHDAVSYKKCVETILAEVGAELAKIHVPAR